MRINELAAYLDDEFDYPIDRDEVIAQIGELRLDCPSGEQGATIGASLERLNEGNYATRDELYHSILGTVDDTYIGRKFYDDRGPNPQAMESSEFPVNESF